MNKNTHMPGIVYFILLSLVACASGPRTTQEKIYDPTSKVYAAAELGAATPENKTLKEISELYLTRNYPACIKKVHFFKKKYSNSQRLPEVENWGGLCLLLQKKGSESIPYFQRSLKKSSAELPFYQFVSYNLAKAYFENQQYTETLSWLNIIRTEVFQEENILKYYHLKSVTWLRKNQPVDATRESYSALQKMTQPELIREYRGPFEMVINSALRDISDESVLEQMFNDYKDSPYGDAVYFYFGYKKYQLDHKKDSKEIFLALLSKYPNSTFVKRATEMVKETEVSGVVDPTAIGVLLPLSGKFSKIGEKALEGIELAFGIFDLRDKSPNITLVLEDSGDDAEHALEGLNQLVLVHHVVAVIGPLSSKGIETVMKRSQELRVPLLSLARQGNVSGAFVFQTGIGLQQQASEIARFAIQKLNIRKFAIAHPQQKIGDEMAGYFWDQVDALGGEMMGIESYAPEETDFRSVVDKLSGLYYKDARKRELDELLKIRTENNIKKKTRKNEYLFNLRPIAEFQAVFVPDSLKEASRLFPTFPYRDVENITFLGPSAWNDPEQIRNLKKENHRAYFVDSRFLDRADPEVAKFYESYLGVYQQDPSYWSALAFDTAEVLGKALKDLGPQTTRMELTEKLHELKNFDGVTGKISYKSGQFMRDLKLYSIEDGRVLVTN